MPTRAVYVLLFTWLTADAQLPPPPLPVPPEAEVIIPVPLKRLQKLQQIVDALSAERDLANQERDEAKEQLFNHIGQCT